MQSVLVLNSSYQPLSIVSAKRAVKLIVNERATPLDGSGHFWTHAQGSLEIPYVVLLNTMVKQGRTRPVGYSRKGVLARDNYSCVYCGNKATTIDHVIPRSKGGKDSFENCVACCESCNHKKADRSLEQMGWNVPQNLLKAPSPMFHMLLKVHKTAKNNEKALDVWRPYINMYDPNVHV